MNHLARAIALAALLAAAPAYAFDEHFGTCFASGTARPGTVETVRELAEPRDIHAFDPDVLEHKLRPETSEVLVVRLDAGPLVTLDQRAGQRLSIGQRVLVTPEGAEACLAPLAGLAQRLR